MRKVRVWYLIFLSFNGFFAVTATATGTLSPPSAASAAATAAPMFTATTWTLVGKQAHTLAHTNAQIDLGDGN